MAPHLRFNAAVHAMKDIGIPPKMVKPVLKKLLELYYYNWALIEEESYRALADAIFEQQDSQKDAKNKAEVDNEREKENGGYEHEPPQTWSRLRIEERPASPSSRKRPIVEEPRPLRRRSQLRLEEPPSSPYQSSTPRLTYNEASSSKQPEIVEEPLKRRSRLRSEEACGSPVAPPPSSQSVGASSFKRLASEGAVSPHVHEKSVSVDGVANLNSFKRPKTEPSDTVVPFPISSINDSSRCSPPNANGVLNDSEHSTSLMPKLEPFIDDYVGAAVVVPLAIMHPSVPEEAEEDYANRLGDPLETLSQMHEDGDEGNAENVCNSTVPNKKREHSMDPAPENSLSYELASTSLGEVKLAISCNYSHTNQDFHVPGLDVVMKLAEDRALKSYKILGSSFSIMKLMKEICQCFLELATDAGEQQKRITTITPNINMSKLRKDHILGSMHASLDLHSTLERMLPQIPHHISLNCIDGLRRKKKADSKDIENDNVNMKELKSMEFRSSTDIVLAQKKHSSSIEIRVHDVSDISKGEEKVQIPIINEASTSSEPYPHSFHYIPNNIVYQNAYVNFSLACIGDEDSCPGCFGDCLSGSIPCSCARETGGIYAYTLNGLVREEILDEAISIYRETDKVRQFFCKECPLEKSNPDTSCKGHLVRRFIKECWSKCGCHKYCGNRVVQRGIITSLEVFFTPEGKGWGLRTFDPLPRGAFVCEYVGEILTNTELYNRNSQSSGNEKHHYQVLLDADWGSEGILKDEEALCLDATHYGNVARFINHRCFDANLVEIPVEIETPDHHYYHLAFFTTREVEAQEELTWDYGIDFDDADHLIEAFQCLCGSRFCRSRKHSNS